ncbi:MAG: hypothetical protein RR539_04925 [Clostridium sp.]|uniref:tetratricopeptide repeat protein n=1 Tax=Clostridium sp. TaxID=1506 RepID=UPI002FC667E3
MENKKLKLNQIKIISPGIQIKNKILEEFESIDSFAEKFSLYPETVHQYLFRKDLGSTSFKIKLTSAFNTGFNNIYKTEKDQIKEYVESITNNISQYNRVADEKMLDIVKNLCFKNEMFFEFILMCRNYSLYYYGQGLINRSVAYASLVLNFTERTNNKKLDKYIIELLHITSTYDHKSIDINKHKKLIKNYISKKPNIDDREYCEICSLIGKIYHNIGEYHNALKYFTSAMEYADSNGVRASEYIHIAREYQCLGNFNKSLYYYDEFTKIIEPGDYRYSYYLEGMAYLNFVQGYYIEAEEYVNKLIKTTKYSIFERKNEFLRTIVEVKLKLSKEEEAIKFIEKCFNRDLRESVYICYNLILIENIIDSNSCSVNFLESLKNIILNIKRYNMGIDKIIEDRIIGLIGKIIIAQENKKTLNIV